ncbi:protein of unknown function [Sporobacter termitidis DSM 10068]|uniref:DUF4190 domain-containing protein n=1 Tax=Sporobacter termitidis DSM 10068 TaxID=1123282 RepID=A0A1M5ZH52_9FIRM|nr:DUF4190 domain-containing protein [Sporobacter termitidis]SHI23491.1 protein of unknown function [Sporobacter termitidis DSM 10068]
MDDYHNPVPDGQDDGAPRIPEQQPPDGEPAADEGRNTPQKPEAIPGENPPQPPYPPQRHYQHRPAAPEEPYTAPGPRPPQNPYQQRPPYGYPSQQPYAPQNPYAQYGYNPYQNYYGRVPGSGKATASLVLGIVSLVFAFMSVLSVVSLPCGIIGLILGNGARKELPPEQGRGQATAGMICSIVGLVIAVIVFAAFLVSTLTAVSFYSQYGPAYGV